MSWSHLSWILVVQSLFFYVSFCGWSFIYLSFLFWPRYCLSFCDKRFLITPVVRASALTWFITYILLQNVQFLNHVINIKTKVLVPQVYMILAGLLLSCLDPLVVLLTKTFTLFGFRIFWLWAYLIKFIPETHLAHWIWYNVYTF
jgi:hypothetical protein